MQATVYTAITNNFDRLPAPEFELATPIAFLDRKTRDAVGETEWNVRSLTAQSEVRGHPYYHRLVAKQPKLRPQMLGDRANDDFTIWIDPVVRGMNDVRIFRLGALLDRHDVDLLTFSHPSPRPVEYEIDACLKLEKDEAWRLERARTLLDLEPYVPMCGIIVRRALNKWRSDPIEFHEAWFQFCVDVTSRDQISFQHFAKLFGIRSKALNYTAADFGLPWMLHPHEEDES